MFLSPGSRSRGSNIHTRTRTVLSSSGSGIYYRKPGCKYIEAQVLGCGAGGQGNSSAGLVVTSATSGGTVTFGTLVANGGSVNAANNYPPSSGGTATGGDINVTGTSGGGGTQLGTAGGQIAGGTGGSTILGAGGQSLIGTGGLAATVPGTGGGGGGATTTSNQVAGAGGSAGGYCNKLIASPVASYSWSIGSAGAAGIGLTQNGAAGAIGMIIIDEFYSW